MALEKGAGRQVHDSDALADAVALYLEQPSLLAAASGAASDLVAENRGALSRTLEQMSDALRRIRPQLVTGQHGADRLGGETTLD